MVEGQNGIMIGATSGACGRSAVGRVGGWQYLRLGLSNQFCIDNLNMSVVAGHELMHALGFRHEQSRNDTLNYIIFRKNEWQSKIHSNTQNFGFAYDFGSVMHYPAGGNHEQGLYDLINLPRFYQQTIGQRERISFKDAAIISRIYCEGKNGRKFRKIFICLDSCKGHEDKCQNGGYLNPKIAQNAIVRMDTVVKTVKKSKRPEAGKKARIQFKSLNNLFECTSNCSSAYVEVPNFVVPHHSLI
ncbi:hypothetical protein niasHT_026021 [Heterodera trifolii]|uniref:Metalloendopeptidase n=1 Tax=Heterodera trifolii TaxID=157864 RepID=A0ABD2KJR4_9BILA